MKQRVFCIIIDHRGRHRKGIQSFGTLSEVSSYNLSFLTITKCFCHFINIKSLMTIVVSFYFFLWILFCLPALCEMSKMCCSILVFMGLSIFSSAIEAIYLHSFEAPRSLLTIAKCIFKRTAHIRH
jgi:hypothetical protein